MVEIYKKEHYTSVLDFVKTNLDSNFFIENKELINNKKTLNKILKKTQNIYLISNKSDVYALGFLWKTNIEGLEKTYIKFNVLNKNLLHKILTVILWNHRQLLYILINKNSNYISTIKHLQFYPKEYINDEILFEYNPLRYKEKKDK